MGRVGLVLSYDEVRLPGGKVIQHPNEEVRSRIELVFSKFDDLRSANGVARYMRQAQLPIPVRPLYDHVSTAHEWRPVTRQHILYRHVSQRLDQQLDNAREWREVCLNYFGQFACRGNS